MTPKRILLLAPHPDDIEFACGASVNKLIEEGNEVWQVVFSPCKKSVPEGFSEDVLYQELKKASQQIGVQSDHLITFNFPVRDFIQCRQEILEEMIKLKQDIKPDWVFMPNSKDVHQDHHQIYLEGQRAFKFNCLIGYEFPYNNLSFTSNFHIKLEYKHLEAKLRAIQEFKSQSFRPYSDQDYIESLARIRGVQVNAQYAEAFELIRWII